MLVDDDTLKTLGQEAYGMRWPFRRSAFAGLIAALDRAGASRIVLDFTFFEPSDEEQDLLLASTAAAVPSVVLADTVKQAPVIWGDAFRTQYPAYFAARRVGHADLNPDSDGVVRHYLAPGSLAASAFAPPASGAGGILHWHGGLQDLKASGSVPVLSATRFLVRGIDILTRVSVAAPDFAPESIARALAAEPALTGESFDAVRGRTVFVGANASGTFEAKQLPVGEAVEPGVLIHWTAWTNLKEQNFIAEVPRWVALLSGLFVAGLVGLFGRHHRGLVAPGLAAGGLMVLCLAAAYAAHSAGGFFPPATPVAASLFAFLGVTAESYLVERQHKREIQAIFGSYVAPGVVDLLMRDPTAVRLGGEKKELTALFSDLAGFTDLSEKIPPEHLLAVINLYLQEVSDCLLANGAYIDKYIGDAVMAVFGAPQSLPDHAAAACEGALAAQRVLASLNPRFERDYGCTLRMRIGINSGDMIVGNMGSVRKRNYTVLGDAVNLASRLEAANKEFGTSILLGETTAKRIQGRFATRPLTRLRVKGKTEAVEVHELVGLKGALPEAQQAFLTAYNESYRALVARRFAQAAAGFARARELVPDDVMAAAWQEEAAAYAIDPPPPDWQPLLKLTSK